MSHFSPLIEMVFLLTCVLWVLTCCTTVSPQGAHQYVEHMVRGLNYYVQIIPLCIRNMRIILENVF